jgi:Cu-processing system permease protein
VNAIFAVAILVIKELYRRKDFYVLFVLTALITLIMGAVTFFDDDRLVRYLKEICLLLIWIAALVIAVTTAARQIPAERENRTIFPLLAKPITRAHLLLGKFVGCWFATGIALLVFYLFFGLISGSREQVWPILSYGQAVWLHWCMLGIVIAMVLLGSVIFSAPSSNATISLVIAFAILILGRHLNQVALQMTEPGGTLLYLLYYAIPHLELFDVRDLIIHNWEPIPWFAWAGASLYAGVYAAFFLLGAWLVFRRQPLN